MYFLASSIISGWDLGNYVLVSGRIELLRVVITLEQYIMWQLGYDTHPTFQLENLSFFSFLSSIIQTWIAALLLLLLQRC